MADPYLTTRAATMPADAPFGPTFDRLFGTLRTRGFEIGVEEYLKAQQVIFSVSGSVTPTRVRRLLAPIIARSADEQRRFHAIFDEVYPELTRIPGAVDARERPATAAAAPHSADAFQTRRRKLVVALVLASTMGAVMILASRPEPATVPEPDFVGPEVTPELPDVQPLSESPEPVGPVVEAPPWWALTREHMLWLTILVPTLVFALLELRARWTRRAVIVAHRSRGPPLTWQTFERDTVAQFYDTGEIRGSVRSLLRREPGEATFLSIPDTIRETIRAVGYPRLEFRPRTRSPEYLALVQRASVRDHQAALVDHLIGSLVAEDLPVERYFYDADPRVCYRDVGEAPVRLEQLSYRHDTSRLLIFGDGAGLLHPVTGELEGWVQRSFPWPRRAVLSPVPVRLWSTREAELATHFVLAPATPKGLDSAVTLFEPDAEWAHRPLGGASDQPAEVVTTPDLTRLEALLGPPAFRLLRACAVYPELHWDLTVQLSALPEVGCVGIDDADLGRLVRLDWFRRGRMPEELRATLLERLEPETETAVRREIIRLIVKNLAPADSVAGEEQRMDLALQRVLSAGGDRRARREAARRLQRLPQELAYRDEAGVRLVEARQGSGLALTLPDPVKRALFPRGGSLFGMRSVGRLACTLAVISTGLGALWLTRPATLTHAPGMATATGDADQTLVGIGETTQAVEPPEPGAGAQLAAVGPSGSILPPALIMVAAESPAVEAMAAGELTRIFSAPSEVLWAPLRSPDLFAHVSDPQNPNVRRDFLAGAFIGDRQALAEIVGGGEIAAFGPGLVIAATADLATVGDIAGGAPFTVTAEVGLLVWRADIQERVADAVTSSRSTHVSADSAAAASLGEAIRAAFREVGGTLVRDLMTDRPYGLVSGTDARGGARGTAGAGTPTTAAPELLGPLDGEIVFESPPVFRWKSVPGATAYTLQIRSLSGGAPVRFVVDDSVQITADSVTFELPDTADDLLASGAFGWTVAARPGRPARERLFELRTLSVDAGAGPLSVSPTPDMSSFSTITPPTVENICVGASQPSSDELFEVAAGGSLRMVIVPGDDPPYPGHAVAYCSWDPEVVRVTSDGTVLGVSRGEASVRVTWGPPAGLSDALRGISILDEAQAIGFFGVGPDAVVGDEAAGMLEAGSGIDPVVDLFLGVAREFAGRPGLAHDAYLRWAGQTPESSPLQAAIRRRLVLLTDQVLLARARNALAQEARSARDAGPNSLALLPFAFSSPGADLGPLGLTLADLTISDLGLAEDLVVTELAQSAALLAELGISTAGFADPGAAARVGRLLGVNYIVFGTLSASGAATLGLQFTVLDVATQTVPLTMRVSGPLAELFDLQKQLVFTVLRDGLGLELTPAQEQTILDRRVANVLAALAYGRGLAETAAGNFVAAEAQFQQAQQLDPGWEAALDRLAEAAARREASTISAGDMLRSIIDATAADVARLRQLGLRGQEVMTVRVVGQGSPPRYPPW